VPHACPRRRALPRPRQGPLASVAARACHPRGCSPTSPLPHAARMPRKSRTPRRRTSRELHCGPMAVARPVAPPSIRWLLGGSSFTYLGAATLAPPRQTPSHRDRAAAGTIDGSHGELRALTGCAPNQPCHNPSLPLPQLPNRPTTPTSSPPRRYSSRGGHRAWPPAPHLADPSPSTTEPRNRSPGTQGPSPARARLAPASGSPEFGLPALPAKARGHIAKGRIFPGASTQKYNFNSICRFADSCKLCRKL
jgi:hypothetical protein